MEKRGINLHLLGVAGVVAVTPVAICFAEIHLYFNVRYKL